jgi:hypothetical protein
VLNGTIVLSNFDIYATVGARYKAMVREFTTNANPSGQTVINFQTVTDNATIEGIEIIKNWPPPQSVAAGRWSSPPSPRGLWGEGGECVCEREG